MRKISVRHWPVWSRWASMGVFLHISWPERCSCYSAFTWGRVNTFKRRDTSESKAQIFKLLRGPGIDSKESILPAYMAWAEIFKHTVGARNQVGIGYRQATKACGIDSLESIPELLKCFKIPALAGRYDIPVPTRFLASIDCLIKNSSTEEEPVTVGFLPGQTVRRCSSLYMVLSMTYMFDVWGTNILIVHWHFV